MCLKLPGMIFIIVLLPWEGFFVPKYLATYKKGKHFPTCVQYVLFNALLLYMLEVMWTLLNMWSTWAEHDTWLVFGRWQFSIIKKSLSVAENHDWVSNIETQCQSNIISLFTELSTVRVWLQPTTLSELVRLSPEETDFEGEWFGCKTLYFLRLWSVRVGSMGPAKRQSNANQKPR